MTKLIAPDFTYSQGQELSVELRFNKQNKIVELNVEGDSELEDILNKIQDRSLPILDEIVNYTSHINTYRLFKELFLYFNPNQKFDFENDPLICRCFGVAKSKIEGLILSGAKDLLTITNLSKAGGGCGSCLNDIRPLLSIDNDMSALKDIVLSDYKRELIGNKSPYLFLLEDIYPIIESFNESIEVEQLVGHHLYLVGNVSRETEESISKRCAALDAELAVFFI